MRVLGIGGQRMNWLHEKKFWRTLFSSYLIILVFSLLMIAFLFRSSLARMEESETASGRTALQKISDSITHMEQELSGVTSSLSARKEYFSLLHAKRDLTSYKLQRVAELQEELRRQVAYSSYISSIYIWFEHSQLAATTAGYYKTQADFDSMLKKEFGLGLEDLSAQVQGYTNIVVAPIDQGDQVNEPLLAVACGAWDSNGPSSLVLMKLRPEAVWRILESSETEQFWLESLRNGGVLAPPGVGELASSLRGWEQLEGELSAYEFQGESLGVMRLGTGQNFAVYSARSLDSYTEAQRQYTLACGAFLLVYLAVGVGISFLLSRFNYRPIERLNQLILREAGEDGSGGDLAMLEAGVNTLLRYHRDYEHEKFQQEKEQKRLWLLSLFLGEQPEGGVASVLETCGLEPNAQQFMAVGIAIRDYSEIFFDKSFAQESGAFEVAMAAIHSISEELLGNRGQVCLCRHEGRLWALAAGGGELRGPVLEACASAERFARERLGIRTYYYAAPLPRPTQAADLAVVFQELRWGLEQMEGYALEQAVADRNGIERLIRPEAAHLPPEDIGVKRRQLFSAVTAGDLAEADRLYLELRQLDMAFSDASFSTVRAQSLILMGYFISLLPKSVNDAHEEEIRQFMDSVRSQRRDEELIAQMHSWMAFYHQIYRTSRPQGEENPDAAAAAARFILEHYTSADLSVALVAGELKVSTSYLSRVFRKKYEMSVLDYIHRQRVNAAKVFIRESGSTLETIAGRVGYMNALALIRAFKRCEGCTPTEYRRTLQQEGNGGASEDG